jgi:serine protease Do
MDMTSKDLDAFLRLEDAAGKELAKDDDGGGGRNARIQFACPATGEYRIIATTFFGGTGRFTLTVKEK